MRIFTVKLSTHGGRVEPGRRHESWLKSLPNRSGLANLLFAAAMASKLGLAEQTFFQRLLAQGMMTESESKKLHSALTKKKDDDFDDFWGNRINASLSVMELAVRRVKSPADGVKYLAIANLAGDDQSKIMTTLSLAQLGYFRSVIEAIATTDIEDGGNEPSLTSIDLLNLQITQAGATQAGAATQVPDGFVAPVLKLSSSDKETTLRELASSGWLHAGKKGSSIPTGSYGLGPRVFLELSTVLRALDLPDAVKQRWNATGALS